MCAYMHSACASVLCQGADQALSIINTLDLVKYYRLTPNRISLNKNREDETALTHNMCELIIWRTTEGLENASEHMIHIEGLLHHLAQLVIFG